MEFLSKIKEIIPFELKRGTSVASIVGALIFAGFFTRLGEIVFNKLVVFLDPYLPMAASFFSWLTDFLVWLLSISFEVNLFGILIFIISLFPIYRMLDKFFLSKSYGEIIFKEEFRTGGKGWFLNYWGSKNPQRTNRIESSGMVFEAIEGELENENSEYGACFDLKNGIYQGNKYEVICKVYSEKGTTMKFRLWLHDTIGGEANVQTPYRTPGSNIETLKLEFIATGTNALRIHLHAKAGLGKIIVREVIVKKVK